MSDSEEKQIHGPWDPSMPDLEGGYMLGGYMLGGKRRRCKRKRKCIRHHGPCAKYRMVRYKCKRRRRK